MMKRFKEYMSRPYSKGDYYGGIAAMLAIYTVAGLIAYGRYKKSMNAIKSIGRKEWLDLEDDDESEEDGA